MKRPSAYINRGNDTDMNSTMTPMIDVVFLLLVFFVWTASFQIVEQVLESNMQSQLGSAPSEIDEPIPEDDFEQIVLRIGWDGTKPIWNVNDQPQNGLEQIRQILTTLVGINAESQVILFPESIVPLGHVIEAYDIAKLVGFQEVSFAVNPENR